MNKTVSVAFKTRAQLIVKIQIIGRRKFLHLHYQPWEQNVLNTLKVRDKFYSTVQRH